MSAQKVLVSKHQAGAFRFGVLELNAPEKLNALDVPMFRIMEAALTRWQQDPDISLIILRSKVAKAFCAGGDVKNLVLEMGRQDLEFVASEFFTTEYYVDCLFRRFPKPILCLSHGITMGGGIGIMNGCSVRTVAEDSVFAMPELSIGLFPDVGASYFLNRTPYQVGRFFGLTGARFGAGDALSFGFADIFIPKESHDKVITDLAALKWSGHAAEDTRLLKNYFQTHWTSTSPTKDEAHTFSNDIDLLVGTWHADPDETRRRLLDLPEKNPAFAKAKEFLRHGSPLSFLLTHEQLRRGETLDVQDCFLMEWILSMNCCLHGDFREGVRALLIDKDGQPKWSPKGQGLDQNGREELFKLYFQWPKEVPLKSRLNLLFEQASARPN